MDFAKQKMTKQAKIVFVEAFLTEKESFENKEFDKLLQRAGINCENIYIASVVKRKLSRSFKTFYFQGMIPTNELKQWWQELENEISALKPNIIVPLGSFALHAVTQQHEISKYRGSILQSKSGIKVLPTFSLADVMKKWELRPIVLADLRKVKTEAYHSLIVRPQRNIQIIRSVQDLNLLYEHKELFEKTEVVAIDIETFSLKYISCIGIAPSANLSFVLPLKYYTENFWNETDWQKIQECIQWALSFPIVGQNFHYDWCYLKKDGFKIDNFVFDTMLAMYVCHPELPKNLAFLASLFTNEPYWKDDNKNWRKVEDWEMYWKYNGTDAAVTRELYDALKNELSICQNWQTFQQEMSLIPVFVNNTLQGIRFDKKQLQTMRKQYKAEKSALEKQANTLLPENWQCPKCKGAGITGKRKVRTCSVCNKSGKGISLGSPVQLKKLIYNSLKLPAAIQKKSKKTVDIETIKKIQSKYPLPIFETIINYKEISKDYEFFSTKIDKDERLRVTFTSTTEANMISSRMSPFGTGGNLENIKHSAKKLFLADKNCLLYVVNYYQAEEKIIAYVAKDLELISIFEQGVDVYKEYATTIFKQFPNANKETELSKKICRGFNYMIGDQSLANSILFELGQTITKTQIAEFRKIYFERFKKIQEWHKEIENVIKETRTLVNLFGRKHIFLGRPDNKTVREAIMFFLQSTVADMYKKAILEINNVEFLLQVDNTLIFQGQQDNVYETAKAIKTQMTVPILIHNIPVVIPVKIKIGNNWEKVKDIDDFLKEGE
jgi:uracil-DNA glycosylase family 4